MNTKKVIKSIPKVLLAAAILYLTFRNFKLEYLTSWDDLSDWWIDTFLFNLAVVFSGIVIIALIFGIISIFSKK